MTHHEIFKLKIERIFNKAIDGYVNSDQIQEEIINLFLEYHANVPYQYDGTLDINQLIVEGLQPLLSNKKALQIPESLWIFILFTMSHEPTAVYHHIHKLPIDNEIKNMLHRIELKMLLQHGN